MAGDDDKPNASTQYFRVTYPSGWIALVEINRPEKLNAFNDAMWTELGQVFDRLSTASGVRAIVLTGAGDRAFTAGLDVSSSSIMSSDLPKDAARQATHWRRHIKHYQNCVSAVERCEKPVIAALHGYAYGAAIDIATAGDIRLATPSTRFSVREAAIGLAADVGTLSRLPKAVGNQSWVKHISLTAREFPGSEALQHGLVSELVDGGRKEVVERALKIAGEIAALSPVAVQGTKRVLDYSRDHTVPEGLEYVSLWNAAMLQGEDFPKAAAGALKKGTAVRFAKL